MSNVLHCLKPHQAITTFKPHPKTSKDDYFTVLDLDFDDLPEIQDELNWQDWNFPPEQYNE